MRAKRRIKAAAMAGLIATLAMALSGCGEREDGPTMPDPQKSDGVYVQESLARGADDTERWAAPESGNFGQASGGSDETKRPAASNDLDAKLNAAAGGDTASNEKGATSEKGTGSTASAESTESAESTKGTKGTATTGSAVNSESAKPAASASAAPAKNEAGAASASISAATAANDAPANSDASKSASVASLTPAFAPSPSQSPGSSASPASAAPSPKPSPEPSAKPSPKPSDESKKQNSEPEPLKFSELYGEETVRGLKLSDKVNELNGQKVEMIGYMAPPLTATVRFFVLTKVAMSICPFCSTDADWPSDIVVVFMPPGKEIKPTEHEVKVTGTLSVGSQTDEETGFVSLIRINANKTEVLD